MMRWILGFSFFIFVSCAGDKKKLQEMDEIYERVSQEAICYLVSKEGDLSVITKVSEERSYPLNPPKPSLHFKIWNDSESAEKIQQEVQETFGTHINATDEYSRTLLHKITQKFSFNKGHVELVKSFIQFGMNVNLQDSCGNTALHYLVEKKENFQVAPSGNVFKDFWHNLTENFIEDIVELLLKAGADVHIKNNQGLTALDVALQVENEMLPLLQTSK